PLRALSVVSNPFTLICRSFSRLFFWSAGLPRFRSMCNQLHLTSQSGVFRMSEPERKFTVKVYIVQKADRKGHLHGEVLAAKLTRQAAHEIAKANAPAKVTCITADKTPF